MYRYVPGFTGPPSPPHPHPMVMVRTPRPPLWVWVGLGFVGWTLDWISWTNLHHENSYIAELRGAEIDIAATVIALSKRRKLTFNVKTFMSNHVHFKMQKNIRETSIWLRRYPRSIDVLGCSSDRWYRAIYVTESATQTCWERGCSEMEAASQCRRSRGSELLAKTKENPHLEVRMLKNQRKM